MIYTFALASRKISHEQYAFLLVLALGRLLLVGLQPNDLPDFIRSQSNE